MDNELPVVVQISNLYHYPYQRLAIRLRGAPRHARLSRGGDGIAGPSPGL